MHKERQKSSRLRRVIFKKGVRTAIGFSLGTIKHPPPTHKPEENM